ncbi:MAG: sorbosone dehydrogenase family protein [Acidobacteria bacterium]|nr:sorbosone dehydrogenase family protein [Acidobacteriota bacterium]MBI3423571.1 sorbosone dehydrogenase family protein [Acidobacteriota bacterium]
MQQNYRGMFLAVAMLAAGLQQSAVAQTQKNTPAGKPQRIVIKPDGLPKPFATESVRNSPKVVKAPAGATLSVPAGFDVSVYADGDFKAPRYLIEGPNGDVFVSDSYGDVVYLLRDANKDGKIDNATERFTFATGLKRPFGMAIQKVGAQNYFYVGNTDSIVRFKYEIGATKVEGTAEKLIDLPTGGHWTRTILFSKDGKKMYIAVGSGSNVNAGEPEIRAAINEYNPDGSGHRIFAAGIRNPVGLAWNPFSKAANGELWTAVNERDLLGDDLVPEYATSVKDGAFYGWPYAYMGQNEDPRRKGENPALVAKTIVPDVLIEPHAAALGIIFYTGKMFPKEYQGDAFVALHGSWNRKERSGYKIIRIPFEKGKPEGGYENFLTGWVPDKMGLEVWGRPVALVMLRDGSLLVSDDGGNKVWRVTYGGKK